MLGLTVLSALVGVAMLWVFSKTSDQARMKAVKNKVWAALFELRVYVDEPRVTWRAQKSLFAANLRYMGLALRPALWMILPMGLLLLHLEAFYARAPLPVGREVDRHHGDEPRTGIRMLPRRNLTAPPESARHESAGARHRFARSELAHPARQRGFRES